METVLRHRALHDDLTGLPNRPLLLDRLDLAITQAARARQSVSILFLDLDGFKKVNDDLGHAAGDQLLKTVTERVSGCIGAGDTLVRLGGDEFVVLLPDTPADAALTRLVARIRRCVVEPVGIDATSVAVGCSIGRATAPPRRRTGAMARRCCNTPTPRCTAPSSRHGGSASAGSARRGQLTTMPARCGRSYAMRCGAANSRSTTNRR